MSKKITAIVFDMDGVLVEAKEWHYEALNRALALFGFEISRYDHLVTYDGLPTRKKLEMLSLERGLPEALHEFINELKQQYTMQIVHTKCRPVFAHEYALSRLKAEGYKLGLASNSIRDTVETMMTKNGLKDYFDVLLSNQDVVEPKPSPNIYLEAAKKLGVAPEQTLVVEDNPIGIMSAEAAGANLMVVESVLDVTYANIEKHIARYEG